MARPESGALGPLTGRTLGEVGFYAEADLERASQEPLHLRTLLGEDAIPGTAEMTLAFQVGTDRDRFLDAVERRDLRTAVEAHTGPFHPDFGKPGGAAFKRWADLERDRLQTSFLRRRESLVRRRLKESRIKDAQRLARRVHDEAPAVEAQALAHVAAAGGMALGTATREPIARAPILVRNGLPGRTTRTIEYLVKGSGPVTIQYSAVKGGTVSTTVELR